MHIGERAGADVPTFFLTFEPVASASRRLTANPVAAHHAWSFVLVGRCLANRGANTEQMGIDSSRWVDIMGGDDGRDALLHSLNGIRLAANRLENDLIELHNIVRFNHRSSGAREWTQKLEGEIAQLTEALRHFRERVEER